MTGRMQLIIVGYYQPGTGFYRVIENLSAILCRTMDIHYVGVGYTGPAGQEWSYGRLYPAYAEGDLWGIGRCLELMKQAGSGIVLVINDLWNIGFFEGLRRGNTGKWSMLAYIPMDGRVEELGLLYGLRWLDRVVVYTSFGVQEMSRCEELVKREDAGFKLPLVVAIAHGVDSSFHPLGREEARGRLFPEEPGLQDAFIVLNANRWSERKRLDLTLDIFAAFAAGKEDVFLLLHQNHLWPAEERTLGWAIAERGLEAKVGISQVEEGVADDELMNLVYNACEVGLNTSMGEGWGLVSFEHAATGAAQVVPAHSACLGLWEGAGCLIEIARPVRPYSYKHACVMQEIDIGSGVAILERLYADKAYRDEVADACLSLARRREFQWEEIAGKWLELFYEVYGL
ncbi:MAG: glycosyltransferase [Bacteroidetes bacterium]|nr:glycosyltransferase [Bacteroidota bacterium]